jgi:hypothetical protein
MTQNEPFLAVLEYILIPKYINFYGKVHSLRRWTVGKSKDLQSVETNLFGGHTVDALVLTGDEGRDKLR